jgi:hypothetical protein
MYALFLAFSLLTANPQNKITQDVSTNHEPYNAASESKPSPQITTLVNTPSHHTAAKSDADNRHTKTDDGVYIIQATPQTSDGWIKCYVIATFCSFS